MMLSMSVPFAAEVLMETVTRSEIFAILFAVVGMLVSVLAAPTVIHVVEAGTWLVSALMSAGMGGNDGWHVGPGNRQFGVGRNHTGQRHPGSGVVSS